MKKYVVKQEASILYQVTVEAKSEAEALELGQKKLFNGEGVATPYSFEWQEWNKVEDYANNEVGR